jgi:hypothetical protein
METKVEGLVRGFHTVQIHGLFLIFLCGRHGAGVENYQDNEVVVGVERCPQNIF